MNIEHVAMYVNDPDAARDFFIKYLGALERRLPQPEYGLPLVFSLLRRRRAA